MLPQVGLLAGVMVVRAKQLEAAALATAPKAVEAGAPAQIGVAKVILGDKRLAERAVPRRWASKRDLLPTEAPPSTRPRSRAYWTS